MYISLPLKKIGEIDFSYFVIGPERVKITKIIYSIYSLLDIDS